MVHKMSKINKPFLDIKSISWGSPPAPLLPRSLRKAWNSEPLPDWACTELRLPPASTYGDLTPAIWERISKISPRLKHNLTFMVRTHRQTLRRLKCFDTPWPAGLKRSDVAWSVRTRNRVTAHELSLEGSGLLQITFGDLETIEGMGVGSILDFTATLEGAMDYYHAIIEGYNPGGQSQPSDSTLMTAIERIADADWADEIHATDPRFKSYMFRGSRTLRETAQGVMAEPDALSTFADIPAFLNSVEAIETEMQRIDGLSLEDQLMDFLQRLSKANGDRLRAIASRFGWNGSPPLTLEACGEILGITRERVRQIQKELLGKIPSGPVYMPKLDEAVLLLKNHAPLSIATAMTLFKEKGLSGVNFHPESLLEAAELLNKPSSLKIEEIRGIHMVFLDQDQQLVTLVPRYARKLAGQAGVSNVFQVVRALRDSGCKCDEESVAHILRTFSAFEFLDEDWFWALDIKDKRNRLYNVTRKILSVVRPQDIHSIREGVRRAYHWRASSQEQYRLLSVPPVRILRAYYERHPDFLVNGDQISFSSDLDYREELGNTDRVLTEALRASPTGLLDRKGLGEYCLRHGIKETTFSVYTSCSPVLEHVDTDIWKLRGVRTDPGAIQAIREANHIKPRERRVINYGWTDDGKIWIATRIPMLYGSMVIGCPSGISKFLSGRSFACRGKEDGTDCGKVAVDERGTSYGFATFIRKYGMDAGDILIMQFDIANSTVELDIGDDEILDSEFS